MDALRVGLMGCDSEGQKLARALVASSWCKLIAIAGSKADRLSHFVEAHPDIITYNDYRSLLVSQPLDALFVALPPFVRSHYLPLAAERGMPVWMMLPPARRFDEAIAIMEKFEQADCPLVLHVPGSDHIPRANTPELQRLGHVYLACGQLMTRWDDDFDWRGDSVRAGGGVLLNQGYTVLHGIVQVMGMPSTVFAAMAGVSRPGSRFPYDTEDTAAIVCQFTGGGIATINACWTSGPEAWSIDLFGTQGSLRIDQRQFVWRDRAGIALSRDDRPSDTLLTDVESFLTRLRTSPRSLRSNLREHLPTMATIQAAYLSAETGQAESPGAIFQMHDIH